MLSSLEIAKIVVSIALIILGSWLAWREKSESKARLPSGVAIALIVCALLNAGSVLIESYNSYRTKHEASIDRQKSEIVFARRLKSEIELFLSIHRKTIRRLARLVTSFTPENFDLLPHKDYVGDKLIDDHGIYITLLKEELESISRMYETKLGSADYEY